MLRAVGEVPGFTLAAATEEGGEGMKGPIANGLEDIIAE